MSSEIALVISVIAVVVYTVASVWAAKRQAKWMAEMEQKFTNGEPINSTREGLAVNTSAITADFATNSFSEAGQ